MLYTDGSGFPLAVKPSHLVGSTERMDTAEILAAIVEQACLYVPESPVGESKTKQFSFKRPMKVLKEELTEVVKFPKEALTQVESPKEAYPRVAKVSVACDLVRINKILRINLFKAVG